MKYKFSVIIPIYNVEAYLEETLECVINQTIGFEENIQLILINDGSPDNSEEICLKYKEKYPNNITYYKQKNAGVSAARNKGIELVEGEFTTFLDSDDVWSLDAFEIMYNEYKKHPDVKLYSCRMEFFDAKTGDHPLNYKYIKNKIVNILEEYEYPQLSSSSIFIKSSALEGHKYDKNIKYSEDNKFINEIIFEQEKIMMLAKPVYYYRKRTAGTSAIQGQTMKLDWYTITPDQVYKDLFKLSKKKFGKVIKYIQYLVGYELSWRIEFNTKFDISQKDKKFYSDTLISLIKEMDDELIANHRHLDLAKKVFLLEQKYKNVIDKIVYKDDCITLNEVEIKKKTLGFVLIDQIYVRGNKLVVYGKLDKKYVKEKDFRITQNDKEIKVNYYELTNDFNEHTFNDSTLHDYIGINFEIDYTIDSKITFLNGKNWLYPRFKKSCSIFTEYLYRSYHHEGKRTIVLKNHQLHCQKRNLLKSIYYELRNEMNLLKRKKFKALSVRIITKFVQTFKRKELWFISDRVNKADDNGEHFFKYMINNHPDKKVYYVLSKDSVDYERMKEIGEVLDPNSNKYKLLFHSADYVVSSHAENYIFNPLGTQGKFIQDQYYFKFIFLQHGIIKNDLSSWLNVNSKKMDMFVTTIEPEYKSIVEGKYLYGPNVVKLTGLPRYDILLEKQKETKQKNTIMLSLTWRTSLVSEIDQKTGKRLYNEKFKESKYFKFLYNLMTDKNIHKALKEKGYKIRFIPHPNVLGQLQDFPKNEFVEIEENSINYQAEFCSSKLLITDYSSIVFDYAFLKKPIIYYQEDKEEFYSGQLYEQGYFDDETMGFGPVTKDYETFSKELIKIINNDCKLEKKYLNRIEKLFKFKDDKNCERVYEEITKL
jgi:CDP-glycerol glycerophosphotransferase (TagB/SpsB family)/GT2 family glycosyltransferase